MNQKDVFVSPEALGRQEEYMARVEVINERYRAETGRQRTAFVDCYGCQQNEADAENMRGMLIRMGYAMAEDEKDADAVVINTCAVREHAEMRVLGNVGALSHYKKDRPDMIIAVGGCMPQQERMSQKLKRSFPYVDLVFGTHALWRLPEMFYKKLSGQRRVFDVENEDGHIAEGLPVLRKDNIRGWVSIMYGCNNFCSYCIVPYVRGRERSRRPEDVIKDVRELLARGCREINLLGQNVNSYGRDSGFDCDFSDLLAQVCELPGDFIVRFMTSHPKDATHKLIDTIASHEKAAPQLHLPVQSGSDRVLKEMNRRYTAESYLDLIHYAREKVPGIAFTSDIIVGFPGETEEDFEKTVELVKAVRYHSLFTFQFSPREGTPAAKMQDDTPHEVIQERFERLLDVQNSISQELHEGYIGKTIRVLAETESRVADYPVSARSDGGRPVYLRSSRPVIGEFVQARVDRCSPWALYATDIRDLPDESK